MFAYGEEKAPDAEAGSVDLGEPVVEVLEKQMFGSLFGYATLARVFVVGNGHFGWSWHLGVARLVEVGRWRKDEEVGRKFGHGRRQCQIQLHGRRNCARACSPFPRNSNRIKILSVVVVHGGDRQTDAYYYSSVHVFVADCKAVVI